LESNQEDKNIFREWGLYNVFLSHTQIRNSNQSADMLAGWFDFIIFIISWMGRILTSCIHNQFFQPTWF